jgi:two-component system phosphate regulon response regulator PhoB
MNKSIYLLEDDDDITALVSYLVDEIGHELVAHASVASLRSSLAGGLPDLFILDVMLPDGSGPEVFRALKADAATRQVPVLMMSAHANGAALAEACAADDFIAKPFEIDDFSARVQHRLALAMETEIQRLLRKRTDIPSE